ncbi:hypothetical protein LPJ63_002264 [Coemansia sp. RSA 2711]|nr:hypothetical protein LPJ63_002264 [Coemansia sp. RSA 2711]KAJ2371076.1 hypothetical protein H4S02_009678 [Coemansia sp. RSA 2611]
MDGSTETIHNGIWDLDQDDLASERAIAASTQAKLEREFSSSGYKAGIDASKPERMQEGFDQGIAQAIGHGQTVGSLLGKLVAHRMVCQKLNVPPQVLDLDALIMRLRAFKHTTAFDTTAVGNLSAESADTPELTSQSFKALVEDASAALRTLSE